MATLLNFDALIPKIFGRSLDVLRKNVRMSQLVNRNYSNLAMSKGQTITINKPVRGSVTDVTPGPTPPGAGARTPETVSLTLDKWKTTSFGLNEDEARKIYSTEDYLSPQIVGAIADLADHINSDVVSLYKSVYNFHSDAGFAGAHVDPFSSSNDQKSFVKARRLLEDNNAPASPRYFVMSQNAEDAALMNDLFVHGDFNGFETLATGNFTPRFGFGSTSDNQMPTHTAGTAAAATDITVSANASAGVKTVSMAKGASTATVVVGDIFQFASDTTSTYVVTAATTITTGGVSISFEPALKAAVTSTTAVDFTPSHGVAALAFTPDAFTFASRPISDNMITILGNQFTVVDPYTGIPLRLTVSNEFYQTSWYFDVLYGVAAIRPECAVRVAGAA